MTTQEAHPIHPSLRDALMLFERAESEYLMARDDLISKGLEKSETKTTDKIVWELARANQKRREDAFIATVRDHIRQAMLNIPFDMRMLHSVISALDQYLNRSRE